MKIFINKSKYLFIFIVLLLISCNDDYIPKPLGYFRIDLPKKEYQNYTENAPYTFEYPKYAVVKHDSEKNAEPYWINIDFPQFNAKIYISYKNIEKNTAVFTEDSRNLAYKHTLKADAIEEKLYIDKTNKVYGVLYDIKGNAASSVQFYLTDSTKHFLRGALYFNSLPNKDSLAPVINFVRKDIDHMIETLRWKNITNKGVAN